MADSRDLINVILNRREVVLPTGDEDFRYLKHHWGSVYVIVRPSQPEDSWKALARFGNHDELAALTADELLGMIRRHYGPETGGYPFTMRSAGK